jgi:hypothetical protein
MTANKTNAQLAKEWPLVDRGDGRIEILCPHGVGHPIRSLSHHWQDWMGVHGCDLCCNTATFALAVIAHGGKL